MKESAMDGKQAIIAQHQSAEVSQPGDGAFDDPAPPVPPQCPAILRGRTYPILLARTDQSDPARRKRLRNGSLPKRSTSCHSNSLSGKQWLRFNAVPTLRSKNPAQSAC
jgi:hypothetical protein